MGTTGAGARIAADKNIKIDKKNPVKMRTTLAFRDFVELAQLLKLIRKFQWIRNNDWLINGIQRCHDIIHIPNAKSVATTAVNRPDTTQSQVRLRALVFLKQGESLIHAVFDLKKSDFARIQLADAVHSVSSLQ